MSVRRPDEQHDLGNRIATLLVAAAARRARIRCARLERVHAETARLKQSEQARAASLVIEATGWAPPTINRVLADVIARPLTWNLVVSNVPGPQVPFYLLGPEDASRSTRSCRSRRRATRSRSASSATTAASSSASPETATLFADIDQVAADLEAALAEQLAA